ncbi:MAG: hypothetical protein Q8K72_07280, partial [Acidimicrobiales bacterium]|nr:hypothetical protein [Acidimicrobiales bacterium]
SLLAVLVNANDDVLLLLAIAGASVVALPRPSMLRSPWLWAALFAAVGTRQLLGWHQMDDHVVVTTYWSGAIALALSATDPRRTLAAASRLLVGTVFLFAAGWKLRSGEFADGTFFRYTLLFDSRFETVARGLGGTTDALLTDGAASLQRLATAPEVGTDALIQEGARNPALARVFTTWGIAIESLVAVAFLMPLPRRWEWCRHGSLLAFAVTTYLVVPVGGFGTLLLVLGSAQASSDRLRVAYLWGGVALLLWSWIWLPVFL